MTWSAITRSRGRRWSRRLPTAPDAITELTQEHTIIGTVRYMAPEQLECRQVDGRADLFALGAILHEMLSGRKAFDGATLAAAMEKFRGVPTLSGKVSFSPKLHTVFGRQYRVIKIQDNNAKVVGSVTARVVPKI